MPRGFAQPEGVPSGFATGRCTLTQRIGHPGRTLLPLKLSVASALPWLCLRALLLHVATTLSSHAMRRGTLPSILTLVGRIAHVRILCIGGAPPEILITLLVHTPLNRAVNPVALLSVPGKTWTIRSGHLTTFITTTLWLRPPVHDITPMTHFTLVIIQAHLV